MPHTTPVPQPPFADSTPLGLFGLAIGCAALVPIALGKALSPAAFETAATFCLLFGAGGQLLAGLLALANKNLLGGTLFTTFSFNWLINAWTLHGLAQGKIPDPSIGLAVDLAFLVIFVVLSYAFAFHSKLLFAFLGDIVVLYLARIGKELLHAPQLNWVVAACTLALIGLALWIAFAVLVNPTAGRQVFAMPGPLLVPRVEPTATGAP